MCFCRLVFCRIFLWSKTGPTISQYYQTPQHLWKSHVCFFSGELLLLMLCLHKTTFPSSYRCLFHIFYSSWIDCTHIWWTREMQADWAISHHLIVWVLSWNFLYFRIYPTLRSLWEVYHTNNIFMIIFFGGKIKQWTKNFDPLKWPSKLFLWP